MNQHLHLMLFAYTFTQFICLKKWKQKPHLANHRNLTFVVICVCVGIFFCIQSGMIFFLMKGWNKIKFKSHLTQKSQIGTAYCFIALAKKINKGCGMSSYSWWLLFVVKWEHVKHKMNKTFIENSNSRAWTGNKESCCYLFAKKGHNDKNNAQSQLQGHLMFLFWFFL